MTAAYRSHSPARRPAHLGRVADVSIALSPGSSFLVVSGGSRSGVLLRRGQTRALGDDAGLGGAPETTTNEEPGDRAMLTSATRPRWAGRRAVVCHTPPSRLVLPPWLPIRPREKGIMVWRSKRPRRIRASRPHAALSRGEPPWPALPNERLARRERQTIRCGEPSTRRPGGRRATKSATGEKPPTLASDCLYGRPLVKAGLRPPPSAASGLDEGTPIDPSRRRGIDGPEWQATHSKQRGPPKSPLDKHIPIRARGGVCTMRS